MELWVGITIAAAFFQNVRSALQKHLKGRLTTYGATYVRFIYAVPFVCIYLAVLAGPGNTPIPQLHTTFFASTVFGATSQIIATFMLVHLFSYKNFAVGTTFSKLELVMIAALGAVILGDGLSLFAAIAVALSALGVVVLSAGQSDVNLKSLASGITEKADGFLVARVGAGFTLFRQQESYYGKQHDLRRRALAFRVMISSACVSSRQYNPTQIIRSQSHRFRA